MYTWFVFSPAIIMCLHSPPASVYFRYRIGSWALDVEAVSVETRGRPLLAVGLAILQRHSAALLNPFGLTLESMGKYFADIEKGYRADNAYHNAAHAADVMHATYCIMTFGGAGSEYRSKPTSRSSSRSDARPIARSSIEPFPLPPDSNVSDAGGQAMQAIATLRDLEDPLDPNDPAYDDDFGVAEEYKDTVGDDSHGRGMSRGGVNEAMLKMGSKKTSGMQGSLMECLCDVECLAGLFAAAVHDLDHPGLNANFLVATEDPLALRYNDRSPLENHHLAVAFEIARMHETFDLMDDGDYKMFRHHVINAVLATDLKEHIRSLGAFRASLASGVTITTLMSSSQVLGGGMHHSNDQNVVQQVLGMVLKIADVGHASKDTELHQRWTGKIITEFFLQGDRERALGMTPAPLIDKLTCHIPKDQIGFFGTCVQLAKDTGGGIRAEIEKARGQRERETQRARDRETERQRNTATKQHSNTTTQRHKRNR